MAWYSCPWSTCFAKCFPCCNISCMVRFMIKGCNWIGMINIIAVAIIGIIFNFTRITAFKDMQPDWVLPILLLFLGVLIVCAHFEAKFMQKYMEILHLYPGLGVFHIFIGTIFLYWVNSMTVRKNFETKAYWIATIIEFTVGAIIQLFSFCDKTPRKGYVELYGSTKPQGNTTVTIPEKKGGFTPAKEPLVDSRPFEDVIPFRDSRPFQDEPGYISEGQYEQKPIARDSKPKYTGNINLSQYYG